MNFKHEGYNWHHEITHFPHLAVDGCISNYDKYDDFCQYTRWFLVGLLVKIPLTILLLGAYLGCYFAGWANLILVDMPSWSFFFINNKAWTLTNAVVIIIGLAAFIVHQNELRKDVYQTKLAEGLIEKKESGFLYTWYLKFKLKFCPKMDY